MSLPRIRRTDIRGLYATNLNADLVRRFDSITRRIAFLAIAGMMLASCGESKQSRALALTTVVTEQTDESIRQQIEEYQGRVAANPTDPTAIGELGVVYELHSSVELALDAYELAVELAPTEFRWIYYQSNLLASHFDLDQALEKLNFALALRPDYGPAWIRKGEVLMNVNRFDEALESFKQAEEVTDDPYVKFGQAAAYIELNDLHAALTALDATGPLETHPNVQRMRATVLLRLGRTHQGRAIIDNLKEAEALDWSDPIAEEKVAHYANHFQTRLLRVVQFIRANDAESALLVLADLRAEDPTNKHVFHLLSNAYQLRGDHRQALRVLSDGVEHHPDFYVLRTNAAKVLEILGHVDAAFLQLDEAIRIDPKLHWAYADKAQLLMAQKKWLEASHFLRQAIDRKEDDPDLYAHLGICMGFLNRWSEAANLYRIAIEIDPKHIPSYVNLARAETFLNDEEAALRALSAAREHGASPALLASIEDQRERIKNMQIDTVRR